MTSDASDELRNGLREDLLDDFYAECDELLGSIRTHLAQLEAALRHAGKDPAALETVYRSMHSFKGISAIVGLRAAEGLAHAAEELLRALTRGEVALSSTNLNALTEATRRLEQIVTAHRLRQPLPDAADVIAQLEACDGVETPAGAAPSPAGKPSAAADPLRWTASFTPSTELDGRGVNINAVRTRLATLGEIVSAAPVIKAGGGMTFEFALALREVPADLAAWQADGILLRSSDAERGPATPGPAPAPSPSAGNAEQPGMAIAPSHIVRVDLSRLDELMRIVGEMVIHRSRLEERIAATPGDRSGLQEVNLALGRSLRGLREAITRVRLVPVAEIFARLPFVVRDLTQENGKRVRLVLEGQDTEIDKYLVERLKEPLLHLVRNAISHGIEAPDERIRAGKPADATLALRAATSGQSVIIEIRDDGRGVDIAKVTARAAELGLPLSAAPTDSEVLNTICQPGFSTREAADRASGRGVGMAVVHTTVRDLSGSLSLATASGQWTKFTLRLPLTLSIADTFLVSAAGQTCAVPQGFVEEVLRFAEADVRIIQDTEVIPYRDGLLPLVRLQRLFGAGRTTAEQLPLLVLGSERGLCGLVVDQIHGQREVVVRAMQDELIQVPGVSGATELGDGRPVLILDPVALSSGAVRPRTSTNHPFAENARRMTSP